jgi:hypothetical protein
MMLMASCWAVIAGLMVLVQLRLRLRQGNQQRELHAILRERARSVN